jgi:hypothetical protein
MAPCLGGGRTVASACSFHASPSVAATTAVPVALVSQTRPHPQPYPHPHPHRTEHAAGRGQREIPAAHLPAPRQHVRLSALQRRHARRAHLHGSDFLIFRRFFSRTSTWPSCPASRHFFLDSLCRREVRPTMWAARQCAARRATPAHAHAHRDARAPPTLPTALCTCVSATVRFCAWIHVCARPLSVCASALAPGGKKNPRRFVRRGWRALTRSVNVVPGCA